MIYLTKCLLILEKHLVSAVDYDLQFYLMSTKLLALVLHIIFDILDSSWYLKSSILIHSHQYTNLNAGHHLRQPLL